MNTVNITTLPFELRLRILYFTGNEFNKFAKSICGGNDILFNYKHDVLNRLSEYNTVTKNMSGGYRMVEMRLPDGRLHHTHKPCVVIYNKHNVITRQRWYILGKYNRYYKDEKHPIKMFHLEDDNSLPSTIGYYDDGNIKSESWFVNDIPHRIGYPAYIEYDCEGCIKQEMWYAEGKLDRMEYSSDKTMIRITDKPTIIKLENGVVIQEEYYVEGILHRDNDLPAKRVIYCTGTLILKWIIHGILQRDNYLPAVIFYRPNGNIRKQWYENGKLHRSRISTCNEHDTSLLIRTNPWIAIPNVHFDSGNLLPADVSYNKHQNAVIREGWFNNGKLVYLIEYNHPEFDFFV